jgi:hypothetical protein
MIHKYSTHNPHLARMQAQATPIWREYAAQAKARRTRDFIQHFN